VHRAFLCGQDRTTGKNVDHRKHWLVERMKELPTTFAVDICSYGALNKRGTLLRLSDSSVAGER
jgi:hypothetical protein